MKKYFCFCFILICELVSAQPLTNEQNQLAHRRYWYYRTRFINDFVRIGDQQGDCICFAERSYLWAPTNGDYKAKVGPDQIDIMNQYLSALALEYRLLTRNNQGTEETLKEIYNILETYNRLDEEADRYWTQPGPFTQTATRTAGDRNGFILREDMPKKYFNPAENTEHFKDLNYGLREDTNFTSFTITDQNTSYCGLHKINDLTDDNHFSDNVVLPGVQSIPKPKMPIVHDKYYSMFIAFMLLVKYVPLSAVYVENGQVKQFADGQTSIITEVRNIADRMYTYMRGNTFGNNNASNWVLEYPDGVNFNVQQLGSPRPYCYAFSKMMCYIQSGWSGNNGWPWPCNNQQDLFTLGVGFGLYNTLYLNPIPPQWFPTVEDASVFLGNVQAGSNAPVYLPGLLPNTWLPVPIPISTAMSLNSSINSVEWADLLRKVLHENQPLLKQKSVYADPISQAPCQGPYNFGINNVPAQEWRSRDRLEHPSGRQNLQFPANYPGVDYMLLHNLYYEYLNQLDDGNGPGEVAKYKNAYNLMDNYDEATWPIYLPYQNVGQGGVISYLIGVNSTGFVSNPNPGPLYTDNGKIKLFQNLTSRAQINSAPPAPYGSYATILEYRAGKDITLLPEQGNAPGFHVVAGPGSDFYAHIQRYVCAGDDNNQLQNRQSQNTSSNDFETDDMNTTIPIHHVYYPPSNSDYHGENSDADETYTENLAEMQNAVMQEYQKNNSDLSQLPASQNDLAQQRFTALPNPNNGQFKIVAARMNDDEIFSYSITDMKGIEILHEENIKSNINKEIDLSNYAEGIYLIKLNSSLGSTMNKKITVMR
jgi:hypothetical protein